MRICDSVKNGGNYDGILGVMSAMEVLETEVTFGDHIYLSEPFERNLEIVSTTQ